MHRQKGPRFRRSCPWQLTHIFLRQHLSNTSELTHSGVSLGDQKWKVQTTCVVTNLEKRRICLHSYVRTEKDGDSLKARVRVLPRQEPQMPWSCAFLLESGIGGEEHSDAMKMGLHPETCIIS